MNHPIDLNSILIQNVQDVKIYRKDDDTFIMGWSMDEDMPIENMRVHVPKIVKNDGVSTATPNSDNIL